MPYGQIVPRIDPHEIVNLDAERCRRCRGTGELRFITRPRGTSFSAPCGTCQGSGDEPPKGARR